MKNLDQLHPPQPLLPLQWICRTHLTLEKIINKLNKHNTIHSAKSDQNMDFSISCLNYVWTPFVQTEFYEVSRIVNAWKRLATFILIFLMSSLIFFQQLHFIALKLRLWTKVNYLISSVKTSIQILIYGFWTHFVLP